MTDQDEKAKSGNEGGAEDDAALWGAAVREVKPLKKQIKSQTRAAPPVAKKPPSDGGRPPAAARPERARGRPDVAGAGLDRRSDERLRRGKMPIEATLDLHGMSQQEAFEALQQFLRQGYERGRRCVLVVTGKGRGGEGVLRARVPEWLAEKELCDLVLRSYPAQPQHGGAGARYILLRRKR